MFLILLFVSSFRGDFTTDYPTYSNFFSTYRFYSFEDILKEDQLQELGYVVLNKIIGEFTDNSIYLFIITSFMILILYFHQIARDSKYAWLSLLLFITVGDYYPSFNILRQILAVAIIFSGSKYLYERNFYKYCIVILLAFLFHRSSIIMLPFYFLLNLKISFKNIVTLFSGSLILILVFDKIFPIIQQYFYSNYTSQSYGITGQSWMAALWPFTIAVFCTIHNNKFDKDSTKQNVWFNASIFYALFSILSIQIQLVQRLMYFFSPYILLAVPLIINKLPSKFDKLIYKVAFSFILLIWHFIAFSDSGYDPFYFIWQK